MNEDVQDGDDRYRVARRAQRTQSREMAKRIRGAHSLRPIDTAVGTVLAECHRNILWFLRRRIGDGAEEVLRAFFVEALAPGPQLPHAESLRTRFGRLLQRAMVQDYGRGSARGYGAMLPGAATAVEPEEGIDAAVCTSLYMLLPTLKREYAEVLWRADLVGEERDRTAKSLGTTANNIGVRLYRARSAFRKRLEQMCLTCPIHGFLDCTCAYANAMRSALTVEGHRRG